MSSKYVNRVLPILIFIFAFLQYVNTLGNDFAWDDKIVIQENERVQQGISGIPDLFIKYSSDLRQDKYGYRPITLTTFAIEYSLFSESPAGYHFMNVLYFSLLCLVLFWVMRRLFDSVNPLIPFMVAMLFAAHPIHVEVVANIKSRDEILAMLFGMLAVYHFFTLYNKWKWKHLVLGSIFYLFAFLSRENAVTFLAIIPLAILVQGSIQWKSFFKSTAVLPVLGIVTYLILNYALTSQLGQEKTSGFGVYEENHILGNSFYNTHHFGDKVANAFHLILLYVKKFFVAYPLTYYSGYNQVPALQLSWQVVSGMILTLTLLVSAMIRFRKNPMMAFGILFFFISLSVYLQMFGNLSDTMADRFLFIPSLGLCMLFVGLLVHFLKPFKNAKNPIEKFSKMPIPFRGAVLSVFLLFAILTFSRNGVWKDDFTLVSTDLPHLENSARAHYYYASLLNKQLRDGVWNGAKEKDMIEHYERSMEISDSIYYGRLELAAYYNDNKRFDEGIAVLEKMVKLFPKTSDPRHFLGQAYVQLENYEDAVVQLEKSIEFAPRSHDSYYLLAISYSKTGQFDKAIAIAEDGLQKFPESSVFMYEALGHIYFDKGDLAESTKNTLKMIALGRDAYSVYATIIGRYQLKGDAENAALYYQSAVQQGIMEGQPG